jgi:hypothetical protein
MANTFKNASIAVNTTPGTIIYTVPLGRTAVVHTLVVSNIQQILRMSQFRWLMHLLQPHSVL